jgi:hypothetical protein
VTLVTGPFFLPLLTLPIGTAYGVPVAVVG